MDPVEAEFGYQVEEAVWTRVDLILDEICKHLSVGELKQVRLLNKSFCVAGAKFLARKTLIRLTGIVDLRPVAEKVPVLTSHCCLDADFFHCGCGLEVSSDYHHIDTYRKWLDSAAVDDSLKLVPKNVSVVSSSDVGLLPLPHFSRIETLQVVTFRAAEGLRILVEFPWLFPNLKSLELKYIQQDAPQVGFGQTEMEIEDDENPGTPAEIQLEELAISVSAQWTCVGSNVFHRFRKLKNLKLIWSGDYPLWIDEDDPMMYNDDGDMFANWLQGPAFCSRFPILNDVSLRLDLTPKNLSQVGPVLNSMKLVRLTLQLHGSNLQFSQFILGLHPQTVTALAKLQWAQGLVDINMNRCPHVEAAVTWLCNSGFLKKPEWELTFQYLQGCLSIVKTKTQLVEQNADTVDYCILSRIISKYPEISALYNYTFRRFRGCSKLVKYQGERFGPEEQLFERYLNSYPMSCEIFPPWIPEWHWHTSACQRAEKPCKCQSLCRKSKVLLCEIPSFLQEIGAVIPHEHITVNEEPVMTDFYCYIPPNVLKKWLAVREQWEQYYKCQPDQARWIPEL